VTALVAADVLAGERHVLHRGERTWDETNCYVDLFIELLHALGQEPLAACAFTLASDFEVDQWALFKFPPEDLRRCFGLEVAELQVWRPLADHVADHLAAGRLLTVEVDAWFLPDTAGVSHHIEHVKTTIAPFRFDPAAGRLAYFHNAGAFEVSGPDLEGLLAGGGLAPYVEVVKLDRLHPPGVSPELVATAGALASEHLSRRPDTNPVRRLAERLEDDLGWLTGSGIDTFHRYAFATCRQCGAAAELAAAFLSWLGEHGGQETGSAVDAFRALADAARTLQLVLARVVRGRRVELSDLLDRMAGHWDAAVTAASAACGR
jgi:hypothetical protein